MFSPTPWRASRVWNTLNSGRKFLLYVSSRCLFDHFVEYLADKRDNLHAWNNLELVITASKWNEMWMECMKSVLRIRFRLWRRCSMERVICHSRRQILFLNYAKMGSRYEKESLSWDKIVRRVVYSSKRAIVAQRVNSCRSWYSSLNLIRKRRRCLEGYSLAPIYHNERSDENRRSRLLDVSDELM